MLISVAEYCYSFSPQTRISFIPYAQLFSCFCLKHTSKSSSCGWYFINWKCEILTWTVAAEHGKEISSTESVLNQLTRLLSPSLFLDDRYYNYFCCCCCCFTVNNIQWSIEIASTTDYNSHWWANWLSSVPAHVCQSTINVWELMEYPTNLQICHRNIIPEMSK